MRGGDKFWMEVDEGGHLFPPKHSKILTNLNKLEVISKNKKGRIMGLLKHNTVKAEINTLTIFSNL